MPAKDDHKSGYTWLTHLLERVFPFRGRYFYYDDDPPTTPAQLAEIVIICTVVAVVITTALCFIAS